MGGRKRQSDTNTTSTQQAPQVISLRRMWFVIVAIVLALNAFMIHQQTALEETTQKTPSDLRRQHQTQLKHEFTKIVRKKKKPPSSQGQRDVLIKSEKDKTIPKDSTHDKQFNVTTTDSFSSDPVFSICLLTKDDVDILPEWIAYHYHALGLRHLVTAVDPSSSQSPHKLFQKFRRLLPDLRIDLWTDKKFMPDYFMAKNYTHVPNFMGRDIQNMTFGDWCATNNVRPVIVRDMTVINNHRFRQVTFVSKCTEFLLKMKYQKTYMSPLDSDEYFVINPLLKKERDYRASETSTGSRLSSSDLGRSKLTTYRSAFPRNAKEPWQEQKPKGVLRFLEKNFEQHADHRTCLNVPRLLFGSVEDGSQHTNPRIPNERFNLSLIETLRWKYHAAYDDERNHLQKVILDISKIPEDDEIFTDKAYSVHQPSTKLCAPEVFGGGFDKTPPLPLAANHYLGSWERYFSRKDKRRSSRFYKQKSDVNASVEDGWIDGWLNEFIDDVGLKTAKALLKGYVRND